MEIECPVCGLENINADQDTCPQCDSDLSCFKVLDSFYDVMDNRLNGGEAAASMTPPHEPQSGKAFKSLYSDSDKSLYSDSDKPLYSDSDKKHEESLSNVVDDDSFDSHDESLSEETDKDFFDFPEKSQSEKMDRDSFDSNDESSLEEMDNESFDYFDESLSDEIEDDLSEELSDEIMSYLSGEISSDEELESATDGFEDQFSDDAEDKFFDETKDIFSNDSEGGFSNESEDDFSDDSEGGFSNDFEDDFSDDSEDGFSDDSEDRLSDEVEGALFHEEGDTRSDQQKLKYTDDPIELGDKSLADSFEDEVLQTKEVFEKGRNAKDEDEYYESIDKMDSGSALRELVAHDDEENSLPQAFKKSSRNYLFWQHVALFVLLPLLIIMTCSAVILFLGRNEFITVNEQLSKTVQVIFESENRVTKKIQELESIVLHNRPDLIYSGRLQETSSEDAAKVHQQKADKVNIESEDEVLKALIDVKPKKEAIEPESEKSESMNTELEKDRLVDIEPEKERDIDAEPENESQIGAKPEKASQTGVEPEKESQTGVEPEKESQIDAEPQTERQIEVNSEKEEPVEEAQNKKNIEDARIDDQNKNIKHIKAVKQKKRDSVKKAVKQLPEYSLSKESSSEDCFKIYHAHDSDTLWNIAQKVYGSGRWYPVLLVHNDNLSIYNISSINKIRYLCDKKLVQTLYNQQFYRKKTGGKIALFWHYKVKPGDTLDTIRHQYCPKGLKEQDCIEQIDLPAPGEKILIRLE
ncbi:hypothetical protein MTBBW1_1260053 [Desulfamplus magnetovallimortis]|uniref:LysM domain-containing protein n=1 Tax=Desulfamplus magnetovallimortis TaxID=1246637 RepID=A0A1W1H6L8_9BACT|nr:hypothetical protein [Desulfamplus magnetovallimortis]SLM28131.1 hypothetical protein MTBBW1_1260053 [Desulfamplus magnetovallimortis]